MKTMAQFNRDNILYQLDRAFIILVSNFLTEIQENVIMNQIISNLAAVENSWENHLSTFSGHLRPNGSDGV